MRFTHAVTFNGKIEMGISAEYRPVATAIRDCLNRLDGRAEFAFSLWRIPDGETLGTINSRQVGNYLQCAGSAQRMTLEVRTESAGQTHHYTIGHPGTVVDGASVEIEYERSSVFVFPNELFDAQQATDVFVSYYESDSVPSEYPLRPL